MPMNFKTSAGSGDFKSLSAGSHFAVCNLIADMGLQPGSGMYPAPKHQIYVRFEVPSERVQYKKDGKDMEGPIVIGQFFTASMNEKANLRKQLESWRGKRFTDEEAERFDVSTVLGQSCMLTVTETNKGDKIYSNISAISPLPKGTPKLTAENPLLYFADDNPDTFPKLPPWLQEKINKQLKPEASHATGIYAEPDMAGRYNFGDNPPVEAYNDYEGQGITDEDIPF